MSAEEYKAIVRRGHEAISRGDTDALVQLLTPDYVDHGAPPGQPPGLEGVRQSMAMLHTAFPDLEVRAEDLIAEGDKVAARVILRGTQHGAFQGLPPTGKHVTVTGIEVFRIANGKAAERWAQLDLLGMMQQLGVIPAPGQASQ